MFITANEANQIRLTVAASYQALEIIEDTVCHTLDRVLVALTSDRALACYRTAFRTVRYMVMLSMAAAFFAGVGCRELWNRFDEWQRGYVAACEAKNEEGDVQEEGAIAPSEPVTEGAIASSEPEPVTVVQVLESGNDVIVVPVKRVRRKNGKSGQAAIALT